MVDMYAKIRTGWFRPFIDEFVPKCFQRNGNQGTGWWVIG